MELNAKSADLSRSAWIGQYSEDFTDVAVPGLVTELRRRLAWAENRIDLPAGRYQTLLPPTAVADLMIYAYWTMSARDAEEGRNVFAAKGGGTRIGERLCELPITLRSDPDWPGVRCAPFQIVYESGEESVFDNGMPSVGTDWIAGGTLSNLYRSRNWAARSGAEYRAAIDNLILFAPESAGASGRAPSLDEMIASTDRGLLLTCLYYIREVDPQTLLLTGLTRDGVYLIEDGAGTRGGQQLPLQRVAGGPARPGDRGRGAGADAEPGVVGRLPPYGHAGATGVRFQHVDCEPSLITSHVTRATGILPHCAFLRETGSSEQLSAVDHRL